MLLFLAACVVESWAPLTSTEDGTPSLDEDTGWTTGADELVGRWERIGEETDEDDEPLGEQELDLAANRGYRWGRFEEDWLVDVVEGTWWVQGDGVLGFIDETCGSEGLYAVGVIGGLMTIQDFEEPCLDRLERLRGIWR